MTALQVIETTLNEGCQLVRPRKNQHGHYDSKNFAVGGNKKGWIYLDSYTASAVKQVYDALDNKNKEIFVSFDLLKMVDITWKLLSKN